MATAIKLPAKPTNWLPTGGGAGAGALLGLKVSGSPLGALLGGAVGGAIGWFYGGKIATPLAPAALQSAAHVVQGGPAAPVAPQKSTAQQVAESGKARASAAALYAYLKVHGPDGTSDLAQLVANFQGMNNSDPQALELVGPLPISAVFDVKTSAALTLYTHDPIPPATPPAAQPLPTLAQTADIYLPGSAALSGSNLYQYLQVHGNTPTDGNLQKLVHQFQIDVNTDPKFPGPAAKLGEGILRILVANKLPENGIYDAATAAAIKVMTG